MVSMKAQFSFDFWESIITERYFYLFVPSNLAGKIKIKLFSTVEIGSRMFCDYTITNYNSYYLKF